MSHPATREPPRPGVSNLHVTEYSAIGLVSAGVAFTYGHCEARALSAGLLLPPVKHYLDQRRAQEARGTLRRSPIERAVHFTTLPWGPVSVGLVLGSVAAGQRKERHRSLMALATLGWWGLRLWRS